jgi:hypothetical protein
MSDLIKENYSDDHFGDSYIEESIADEILNLQTGASPLNQGILPKQITQTFTALSPKEQIQKP